MLRCSKGWVEPTASSSRHGFGLHQHLDRREGQHLPVILAGAHLSLMRCGPERDDKPDQRLQSLRQIIPVGDPAAVRVVSGNALRLRRGDPCRADRQLGTGGCAGRPEFYQARCAALRDDGRVQSHLLEQGIDIQAGLLFAGTVLSGYRGLIARAGAPTQIV